MINSIEDIKSVEKFGFLEGLTRLPTRQIPITNPNFEVTASTISEGNKHSPITIQNRVRARIVGPDEFGNIVTKVETPWADNILTTYGLASMASAVGSSAAVTASFWVQAIYIGTSATGPTSTDTSLGASTASLTMGNASFTKTNTGNMTVEYQATFASSNTAGAYTINEVGLYCNSTGNETQNHLAAHATLATAIIKGLSDVAQFSYQIIWTTA